MNRVVIGVGSNIEPRENIAKARELIRNNHHLVAESRFVETEPIGYQNQPNFLNGAFLILTEMDRGELKLWLAEVERALGRVRDQNKYGPRTIDLDIVVWNGQVVDRDIHEREFLRTSVLELWPELDI